MNMYSREELGFPKVGYVWSVPYSLAVSGVAMKSHLSAGCVDQIVLDLFHDLHGASRVHILAFRLKFHIALHDEKFEWKLLNI